MKKTDKRIGEKVLDRKYYLDNISKLPLKEIKEMWDLWNCPTAEQLVDEVIKRFEEKRK